LRYTIIFQACDNSNNCSNYTQKIKTSDITPPIIKGESNFVSYMSNPLTTQEIISKLKATDNHDGDITSKIYVCESNYQTNIAKVYYINVCVKDFSENKIKEPYKLTITLIDDIPPTIEGATNFTSYLSSPISLKYILSNILVTDNNDKNAHKNLYTILDY
jgi:hypothetical protein